MKFLKKENLFSLVLVGITAFSLVMPVQEVKAIDFGCLKEDGSCQPVTADSFGQAGTQCVQLYGQGTRAALDGCNNFGCLQNDVCRPITAIGRAEGEERCRTRYPGSTFVSSACNREFRFGCVDKSGVCRNVAIEAAGGISTADRVAKCKDLYGQEARTQALECGPEKEYPCFVGPNYCTTVKANTDEGANFQCTPLCRSTAVNCYVDFGNTSCPASSQRPPSLADTDDLQREAAKTLNTANFNTPQDFVRRAINLLLAFIGSITLVLYVVAGLLWMTARGNSEQTDKAKKILVWTTLGVFVMLFSYILVNFLFDSISNI